MAFLAPALPPLLRPRSGRACARRPPGAEIAGSGAGSGTLGRVLVAGAGRGLGLELTRVLVAGAGAAHVTAMVERGSEAEGSMAETVLVLEAGDEVAVRGVFEGQGFDTVLSCLGGGALETLRADYTGVRKLVDAAGAQTRPLARFVLVSALGAGDSQGAVPFQVMDSMRGILLDHTRAEAYLRDSGLPFTIVRPGPLADHEETAQATLTEGLKCYGEIGRKDLAKLLCKAAASSATLNKTLQAVDRTKVLITSPYVRPLEFWEQLPFEDFHL